MDTSNLFDSDGDLLYHHSPGVQSCVSIDAHTNSVYITAGIGEGDMAAYWGAGNCSEATHSFTRWSTGGECHPVGTDKGRIVDVKFMGP
jgi:hypothetical protein